MKNTAAQNRPQIQNPDVLPPISGPGPEIISASALEGAPVLNTHEEVVGQVTHIMIDLQAGDVAYIVIASDDSPSGGNTLHAVPHASMMFDAAHNRFILDIDHERLEQAPSFDREHWPVMSDLEWATQIHDYYGQRNYWLQPCGQKARSS